MHTTHLSEITDDASISLTCALCSCDTNLSTILQYTIKSKETSSKDKF